MSGQQNHDQQPSGKYRYTENTVLSSAGDVVYT